MSNLIEGFKNEFILQIFENRLYEINRTCFFIWKVGVNLALRVSDVLKITVTQAEYFVLHGEYISKDKKTGKANRVKLNKNTMKAFKEALELRKVINVTDNPYLFVGIGNRAKSNKFFITRQAVDKYFKLAVSDENIKINIGTHTMRKTWGNLAYLKGYKIELIMKRLNHSNQATTLLYLGISDEDMNNAVAELNI
ncbi:tyrosine-type recombinase/integrase [Cetobacterium sp. 2A]|uniref:tyrosine-type recombinase/integrase n=1 Tax=Cetobacterium sp. 2A TaxID=2754723 RepID=UPI00163CE427|nr:tyrosine-type recombinase/integrase [Cetobacterium sp. 2A]MBC2856940.1 tyrosine-type recombinase/integrase [Cetobacterium sp. 2A]